MYLSSIVSLADTFRRSHILTIQCDEQNQRAPSVVVEEGRESTTVASDDD